MENLLFAGIWAIGAVIGALIMSQIWKSKYFEAWGGVDGADVLLSLLAWPLIVGLAGSVILIRLIARAIEKLLGLRP